MSLAFVSFDRLQTGCGGGENSSTQKRGIVVTTAPCRRGNEAFCPSLPSALSGCDQTEARGSIRAAPSMTC
jgi:hypothetical protein